MNRRSFFSLAAGAAAIAAALRVKPEESERVSVTGAGLPSGTTMLKADADKLFGIQDPTHMHMVLQLDHAGVPLEDRPWQLQQKLTEANQAAFERRVMSMRVGVDRLVGPL